MRYLVDTGVWLRLFDRCDPQQATIGAALRLLRSRGHALVTCPQNVAEFWNVSTRPANARGGYGQTVPKTELRVQYIERTGVILAESPAAYHAWRQLVFSQNVHGVEVHDARLVAMMVVESLTHILTLNPRDFARYPAITAVTPADLLPVGTP